MLLASPAFSLQYVGPMRVAWRVPKSDEIMYLRSCTGGFPRPLRGRQLGVWRRQRYLGKWRFPDRVECVAPVKKAIMQKKVPDMSGD